MCFAPEVSFGSSALLLAAGSYMMTSNKSEAMKKFTAIPFLFGIQQFSEGILWLVLDRKLPASLAPVSTLLFLFFANMIWPLWIPISMFDMENSLTRRQWIGFLRGIGALVAGYAFLVATTGSPTAEIIKHSIVYKTPDKLELMPTVLQPLLYLASAVAPFFISSQKAANVMGYFVLVGLCITMLAKQYAVTSVWCFFASLSSFVIAYYFFKPQQKVWSQILSPND
jgi:hypothetical protein